MIRQRLSEIMIIAHRIRRNAASAWGCSTVEILFADCLRQAWAQSRDWTTWARKDIALVLDRQAARADRIHREPATRKQVWYLAGLMEDAGDSPDLGTMAILSKTAASHRIASYLRTRAA